MPTNGVESIRSHGVNDSPRTAPVLAAELWALLPGPYYMDPPDGGDVPLLEQLKRTSADAASWRNRSGALSLAQLYAIEQLHRKHEEIEKQISLAHEKLGVTFFGTYQDDSILNAARPGIVAELRHRLQAVKDELLTYGFKA